MAVANADAAFSAVLQLYSVSYAVRLAFLATATLFVYERQ